jgi:4-hydroxy-3-methylbut-2-enyl diphosphate reductase
MDIVFAKESGFCFGVERIIETAENLLKRNGRIFTYGDLIHNKQELNRLEDLGIQTWSTDTPKGSVVLTRAHGISLDEMDFLSKNYRVVDGTCPIVLAVRETAKDLLQRGYHILITGNSKHPEIRSFLSFVRESEVIESEKDVKKYNKKIAIVSQTTFSFERFKKIVDRTIELNKEVHIINTICFTSMYRQKEVEKLSKNVHLMVIIGGKHSSNTRKLFEVASKNTKSFHIETAEELESILMGEEFNNTTIVGVAAGASTPQWIIDNVVDKIKKKAAGGSHG